MDPVNSQESHKISIIIVTYNAARTLQTCLDTIYCQKYSNIEIIVIDGASSDQTVEILKKNASQITFWTSEPDDGIYDAMNKGITHASGDWIYFLGADDELFDEFSDFAQHLQDHSVIYYANVIMEGEKYIGEVNAYRHAKTGLCHQSIIYPSQVFKKYQFDTRYRISADHVLNMMCWKDSDFKFVYQDYVIARFNHTGVSSLNKDPLFKKKQASLILKNYGTGIWLRFLFRQLKARFSTC